MLEPMPHGTCDSTLHIQATAAPNTLCAKQSGPTCAHLHRLSWLITSSVRSRLSAGASRLDTRSSSCSGRRRAQNCCTNGGIGAFHARSLDAATHATSLMALHCRGGQGWRRPAAQGVCVDGWRAQERGKEPAAGAAVAQHQRASPDAGDVLWEQGRRAHASRLVPTERWT